MSVHIYNDLSKTVIVKSPVQDGGIGYSCLNYIKKLSIDKLKIDRFFI